MSSLVQNRLELHARESVLDLRGDMSLASSNRLAMRDVADGLRLWRLAWILARLDIRLRYRGSILGPIWLTLSTAVFVGTLGILYAELFHVDVHYYLPYLALSQVLWGFLATLVGEGCACFTQAEGVIRAVRMPLFLHAIRTLLRNVLVLLHNVVVIVVVDSIFAIWPGGYALLALPGVVVWTVDALAIALLLGAFCARFRDVGPIVGSVMQIAFFLTPVIWQARQLEPADAALLPFNPFYVLLEIVRAPLLGTEPSGIAWVAAVLYSIALCSLSWMVFIRARGRVAFWF
jgi:homopolymeric O-antigen transport system permease protein